MRSKLFFAVLVLFIIACGKKEAEVTENNQPAGNTSPVFNAVMDDTAFTADYYNNSYPGPVVQLYAFETTSGRSVTLTIENKNTGTHIMSANVNGTSASCQAGGGTGFSSTFGQGHGSVTITASVPNSISGTFSFTGYTFNGADSASVSGQFSNMTF